MSSRREWLVVLQRAARTPRGAVGLTVAGLVVLLAIVGPFIAPHGPTLSVVQTFGTPGSGNGLFGGDVLGRDVLSRVLAGGWLLLLVAAAATLLGIVLGVMLGVTAAYVGSWTDGLIMRIVDVLLAFPQLVFALLLVSVAGTQISLLILAVGLSHAPQVARVVRAAALDVCERDFVKAVELYHTPALRVMTGEVLPNILSVVMVEVGLRFTYSILIIAGMSFLGFGLQPPTANWGLMINENRIGLVVNPWAVIVPAALIAILTVALNTFTDAIARASLRVDRPIEQAAVATGITVGVKA
jgi:peptide/nickel transport system permease protein